MYIFLKLIFDKILSLTLILIFIPIFFFLIFINFTLNGSPIFFIQERSGMNKKKIYLIKLRTIKHDCKDINKINYTRFGKFFRRSGLDEIFQLFNILKGDISFVGPRPLYTKYDSLYNQDQSLRLTVKPGLTGLAQIHQKNTTTWEEKINYDLLYLEKKSFIFDLKIFFKTFLILFYRLFDKEFITVSEEFTGKKIED